MTRLFAAIFAIALSSTLLAPHVAAGPVAAVAVALA